MIQERSHLKQCPCLKICIQVLGSLCIKQTELTNVQLNEKQKVAASTQYVCKNVWMKSSPAANHIRELMGILIQLVKWTQGADERDRHDSSQLIDDISSNQEKKYA